VLLAADRYTDAHAHALVHDTRAGGLAWMEMPCPSCIGHGSSLLRHAVMVAEVEGDCFFSSMSLRDSYVQKIRRWGRGDFFFFNFIEKNRDTIETMADLDGYWGKS
jgi:hypothetical protein